MPSTSTKPPEPESSPMARLLSGATQAIGPADAIRTALSGGLAIWLTGLISSRFVDGTGLQVLLASMGASTVILFCVPASPMARLWPVTGGHLLSGLVGIGCSQLPVATWLAAGFAVGGAMLVMQLARCLHPPGGASALVAVLGAGQTLGLQFLLTPLALNVLALLALHRLLTLWPPRRQAAAPTQAKATDDRPALERLGIRREDLHAALKDMDSFVDINETQLGEIYDLAAAAALQRELGTMTCGDIMSRDVVTVEFGSGLEETWASMHRHAVKAIPVVDRARHVIGIITLTDFFRHARIEQVKGLAAKLHRLIRPTPATHSDKPEVAGQIMSHPVLALRQDAPVAELALLLTSRGIHQVPIVDHGDKLVGLVSQTDLIAALYKSFRARSLAPGDSGNPP